MILTCPNCATQYAVKDDAIPPQGRQVRCTSCKHSWHQDPEPRTYAGNGPATGTQSAPPEVAVAQPGPPERETAEPAAADYEAYENIPEAREDSDEDESFAEATLIEPRSGPDAEERAYEEALLEEPAAEPAIDQSADWSEPPQAEPADDDFVTFQDDDVYERPRRRWLPVLFILLLIAALAAVFWFAAPNEWKARLGMASTASPLALVTTHMDRQRLESGNELLTVTGRVINPTGEEQAVPPLSAELRTRAGKVVYRWTIAPPAPSLAPGASASFNSAEVNVPPGGDELTITLGKAA